MSDNHDQSIENKHVSGLIVGIREAQRIQRAYMAYLAELQFNGEFHGIKCTGKKITKEELEKSIESIGYKPEDI